jgi:hypothetical protein
MSLRPIRQLEKSVAYLQSKPDPSNPKQYLINREPPIMNFTLIRPRLNVSFLSSTAIKHLQKFLTFDDLSKGDKALEDEGYLLDGYKELTTGSYKGILKVRLCDETGAYGSTHLELQDYSSARMLWTEPKTELDVILKTFYWLKSAVRQFLLDIGLPMLVAENVESATVSFDGVRWTYFLHPENSNQHQKFIGLFSEVLKALNFTYTCDIDDLSFLEYCHNDLSVVFLSSKNLWCDDDFEHPDQANFTHIPDSENQSIIVNVTLSGKSLVENDMDIESAWVELPKEFNYQAVFETAVNDSVNFGEFGTTYAPPTAQQIDRIADEQQLFESNDFFFYLDAYFSGKNVAHYKFDLIGKDALFRAYVYEAFGVDLCVPYSVIREWYKLKLNKILIPEASCEDCATTN